MGKDVGMFVVTYQIGDHKPGALTLHISLVVSTPNQAISGIGRLFQSVNPPLDVHSNLQGHYSVMCITPQNCHIQIILTGYPIMNWPGYGGERPTLQPNMKILMVVLAEDWQTGSATFAYLDPMGQWHEVKGAPVRKISGSAPSNL